MLEYLRIRNLALIDDASLEFAPGLNVLTGETGAGKSFILKALDFLLGESLGVDNVRPGADAAQVEALFLMDPGQGPETDGEEPAGDPGNELVNEVVIRRELSRLTKRGRAFLNDRLASQARLKELSGRLMLLAGQNAQRRLLSPAEQVRFLDGFLPDPSVLAVRDAGLADLRAALAARAEFEKRAGEGVNRRGLLEFQREQIEALDPQPGEEAGLAAAKAGLAAAERARKRADAALGALLGGYGAGEGALAGLRQASRELAGLADALPEALPGAEEWAEARATVDECLERLAGVADRLRRGVSVSGETGGAGLDVDAIESRLFAFSSLRRKLGTPPLVDDRPVSDLAEWLSAVQAELSFLDELELERVRLDKALAQTRARAQAACDALGQARRVAAQVLTPRLNAALAELGFSRDVDAPFAFEPREVAPGVTGVTEDRPRLLFAPNPGMPPRDLAETASGGELSRVFLALTTLSADVARHDGAALVFDEVDAGIGGLTLDRVGAALRALAATRQVILVTHWSRLARLVGAGDRHFKVEKRVQDGQTYTICRQLDEAGRQAELARMDGAPEAA